MADRNRRREEEKNRLWEEVMNKKRAYEKTDTNETVELVTGTKKRSEETMDMLKDADSAMEELRNILAKQQKDLEQMSRENGLFVDMDQLQNDIQRDYGVEVKPEEKPAAKIDSKAVFTAVEEETNRDIIGQPEAVHGLTIAFRRPFVMGTTPGKAKNVILVCGPKGSGKHEAIARVTRALYERQVFVSDTVYTIDMSRYTSGGQEQIFLQDLYEALQGTGSVICFEKFETGFPSFLRMVDSLATEGKVVLNKRYVLSKGILVENQTGLVKDAVDSLAVEDKYLVFITEGKVSKVQDAFGADFMYHVLDTVTFKPLDDAAVTMLIDKQTKELVRKSLDQLQIDLTIEDDLKTWVKNHFDKTQGATSIRSLFYDFYVSLTQAVLDHNLGSNEKLTVAVKDDEPVLVLETMDVRLAREKTSKAEIAAVNAEMDEIVGLVEVKEYVHSLEAHVRMQKLRREQGMKTAEVSKHMIFTGNPGTGKTTIARLLSRYMKAIGALTQGQLVEVTRADLVAQYVGQTAPLTMSVIRSAIGGVLFIDEAYALYRGKDDAFGLEAIDTLVKAMEDNRDNLIVILAGYRKEMSTFLEANSGLKSRFPNVIYFPDYTGNELVQIAALQAKSKGYVIEDAAKEKLEAFFDNVQQTNAAEAGNGRLARNVIEEAILKQSRRIAANPEEDMSVLKDEDFSYTFTPAR